MLKPAGGRLTGFPITLDYVRSCRGVHYIDSCAHSVSRTADGGTASGFLLKLFLGLVCQLWSVADPARDTIRNAMF